MTTLGRLTDNAETTVEKVEQLNDLLSDIEEIVGFITDIADQTTMLALNANIEAARAGDSGDRFAVVAEEVKSLATETKEATDTQADSTQEVVSMVDDVEGISARTAEEAAVAADAAAEQTTELAEVSTLSERAESLEASLDSFELATGMTAADTDGTVVEFWHAMCGEKALLWRNSSASSNHRLTVSASRCGRKGIIVGPSTQR